MVIIVYQKCIDGYIFWGIILAPRWYPLPMKLRPSSSEHENQVFTSALSKVLSVSHSEAQKAIAASKPERTSKHKRWKYVPEEAHAKP
jgi:hypothetical protein